MPVSKYRLVKPVATPAAEDPSYLDQLKADLDTRSLNENWPRLRGFGAGAIEGIQGIGHGLSEAVKHPMTAAPALTRAATGYMAAEGGLPGAAISAGGELAAEGLEGSLFTQSPLRSLLKIGTAGGIGAIPLASTVRAGRVIPSMARSAAYSGGGELAREVSAGEGIDPTRIGTSTAIGGITGGVLGKLLGLGARPDYSGPRPAPVRPSGPRPGPAEYEIQPTAQTGPGTAVISGGRLTYGKEGKPDVLRGGKYTADIPPAPIKGTGAPITAIPAAGGAPAGRGAPAYPEGWDVTPGTESGRVQKVMRAEQAAAEKRLAEEQQQRAIERQIIDEGLVPGAPSVSETVGPGGIPKLASRTSYGVPEEASAPPPKDPVQKILEDLQTKSTPQPVVPVETAAASPIQEPTAPPLKSPGLAPSGRKPRQSKVEKFNKSISDILGATPPPSAEAPAPPVVAEAPTPAPSGPATPANFFKGPVDVAGQNYRAAKAAEGENPLAARQAGIALNAEAARAGLPTRGSTNLAKFLGEKISPEIGGVAGAETAPRAPRMINPSGTGSARGASFLDDLKAAAQQQAAPAAPVAEPDWIARELADIEARKRGGGETGAASLRALLGLGGAAVGAPIGAAMSDEENRGKGALAGAALGGAAGFGVPGVVSALRRPGALEYIPKWQRSSMLTSSPHSLFANTFAGPWGSGIVMALEKGLSGDSRGWTLLREMLQPAKLGQKWLDYLPEAEHSIGRAEGTGLGIQPSFGERVLAAPGTSMTAGDMAIKDAIQRSGFSPEEARRATLTSEPELFAFKKVADFGKGTPKNPADVTKIALDMAFPFRRTPANIGEQGSLRFPGLGLLMQSMRKQPDPVREQIVQQLLNAGIGAGSYGLGTQLDPETARTVRKYVSNLAGPHSAMASAGFAMGQAQREGQDKLSPKTYQEFADMLPLPTHQAIMDWLKFGGGLVKGELNIPRGMIPASGIKNTGFPASEEPPLTNRSIYRLRQP